MNGYLIATLVTFVVIVLIETIWRRSTKVTITDGKPRGCTCLWFTDEHGLYRAVPDANCTRHEGD